MVVGCALTALSAVDEAAQSTAEHVREVVTRQGEDESEAAAAAEHVAEAIEHNPMPSMPAEEALARQEREHLPGPTQLHAVAYSLRNSRIHTYEALDNFWKRYNKVKATLQPLHQILLGNASVQVLLDKLAIERERSLLNEENAELRSILKQYLDGISVNQEVLSQNNTLLIVNGRTNAPMYDRSFSPPVKHDLTLSGAGAMCQLEMAVWHACSQLCKRRLMSWRPRCVSSEHDSFTTPFHLSVLNLQSCVLHISRSL